MPNAKKTDPTHDDLLIVPEVARWTRSPEATVRWWLYTGQLESLKVGRRRLIPRKAVEAFLARGAR